MKSHIFYNATSKTWILHSLIKPNKFMESVLKFNSGVPVGTYQWKSRSDRAYCNKQTGNITELTFSTCLPNKYTCNSGYCIPLYQKCNTELNCEDESDEQNCNYLWLGDSYSNEILPLNKNSNPLIVYINASVFAFPSIDTMNLKFTTDFYLNLRWNDRRLSFRDLNNRTALNTLDMTDKLKLWVPTLAFQNALGPFHTVVDKATTMVLVREGIPLQEDWTLSTEGKYPSLILNLLVY